MRTLVVAMRLIRPDAVCVGTLWIAMLPLYIVMGTGSTMIESLAVRNERGLLGDGRAVVGEM